MPVPHLPARPARRTLMFMNRSFPVILTPQPDDGFFVECPSLPGCYSQGDTLDESLANIRDAVELVLEDLAELGEPVPNTSPSLLTEVLVDL